MKNVLIMTMHSAEVIGFCNAVVCTVATGFSSKITRILKKKSLDLKKNH